MGCLSLDSGKEFGIQNPECEFLHNRTAQAGTAHPANWWESGRLTVKIRADRYTPSLDVALDERPAKAVCGLRSCAFLRDLHKCTE